MVGSIVVSISIAVMVVRMTFQKTENPTVGIANNAINNLTLGSLLIAFVRFGCSSFGDDVAFVASPDGVFVESIVGFDVLEAYELYSLRCVLVHGGWWCLWSMGVGCGCVWDG